MTAYEVSISLNVTEIANERHDGGLRGTYLINSLLHIFLLGRIIHVPSHCKPMLSILINNLLPFGEIPPFSKSLPLAPRPWAYSGDLSQQYQYSQVQTAAGYHWESRPWKDAPRRRRQ